MCRDLYLFHDQCCRAVFNEDTLYIVLDLGSKYYLQECERICILVFGIAASYNDVSIYGARVCETYGFQQVCSERRV